MRRRGLWQELWSFRVSLETTSPVGNVVVYFDHLMLPVDARPLCHNFHSTVSWRVYNVESRVWIWQNEVFTTLSKILNPKFSMKLQFQSCSTSKHHPIDTIDAISLILGSWGVMKQKITRLPGAIVWLRRFIEFFVNCALRFFRLPSADLVLPRNCLHSSIWTVIYQFINRQMNWKELKTLESRVGDRSRQPASASPGHIPTRNFLLEIF